MDWTLQMLARIQPAIWYGHHHPASDYYARLNAAEAWLICRLLRARK